MLRDYSHVLYAGDRSPMRAPSPSKTFEDGDVLGADVHKLRPAAKGAKLLQPTSEKRYLGVRVRMPVRDMLRKIRIAKGMDPLALPGATGKTSGEKKRVHSSGAWRSKLNKKKLQSLEDLSIIVEVLEEDLKASKSTEHSREPLPTSSFPGWRECSKEENLPFQDHALKTEKSKLLLPEKHCISTEFSAVCPFTPSPLSTEDLAPSVRMWGGCFTSNTEDGFSSTQPPTTFTNGNTEWQEFSPHNPLPYSTIHHTGEHNKEKGWDLWEAWSNDLARDRDGKSFFWFQLQKEEMFLRTVSDDDLLAVDHRGRTFHWEYMKDILTQKDKYRLLHSAVTQGKRALALAIAKRMASLDQIEIRDMEGKVREFVLLRQLHRNEPYYFDNLSKFAMAKK